MNDWCMECGIQRRLPQRHSSLPRQLDDILGMDADRSPGRTGADAGGASFEASADIAFHCGLGCFRRLRPAQALKETGLRCLLGHLDDAVGTVLLAVATADAGLVDEDL